VDDGAAVRIAMTVLAPGDAPGLLQTVVAEHDEGTDGYSVELQSKTGKIGSDLNVGADVAGAVALISNSQLAIKGFELGSQGFLVELQEALNILATNPSFRNVLKPYMNGQDLINGAVSRYVIDFYPMAQEEARAYPLLFQAVIDNVQPERQVNRESRTVENWWTFRRSGEALRRAVAGLGRIICTTRTAKHRVFQFMPGNLVAESKIVVIASDDSYVMGVLSSAIHACWALRAGAFLTDRPTYNHLDCFNKFPFPDATPEQQDRIRELAEQLDAHRKRQQAQHPDLTMTGMYNVLEKLRSGEPLTAKDKTIHEQGLVSVLKQLHDDLDRAVAAAYGWTDLPLGTPSPSSATLDETILERLVALNHQRAAEEAQGQIRYLRPEYQNPSAAKATQSQLDIDDQTADHRPQTTDKSLQSAVCSLQSAGPWPATLPEQMRTLTAHIQTAGRPLDLASITKAFKGARKPKVKEILDALTDLGRLTQPADGLWQG